MALCLGESVHQLLNPIVDQRREIFQDRGAGEVASQETAAQAVVVVRDCGDQGGGHAEAGDGASVFVTTASARCVDFMVESWVVDVDFLGVDAYDGPWVRSIE